MNSRRIVLAALIGAAIAAPAVAQPPPPQPTEETDRAYSAYQRGQYLTAFKEATREVAEKSDPKSMTLLGELYADGLGFWNDF